MARTDWLEGARFGWKKEEFRSVRLSALAHKKPPKTKPTSSSVEHLHNSELFSMENKKVKGRTKRKIETLNPLFSKNEPPSSSRIQQTDQNSPIKPTLVSFS